MNTPDSRHISGEEALGYLSAERFPLNENRLVLVRENSAHQMATVEIDARLRNIVHTEGYVQ